MKYGITDSLIFDEYTEFRSRFSGISFFRFSVILYRCQFREICDLAAPDQAMPCQVADRTPALRQLGGRRRRPVRTGAGQGHLSGSVAGLADGHRIFRLTGTFRVARYHNRGGQPSVTMQRLFHP